MPYDLHQLGDERFEHLTQALALQVFGPGLTIFGAGTDGGREATFEGHFTDVQTQKETWSGYGVLQAKYKGTSDGMQLDQTWFLSQLKTELKRWDRPTSRRGRRPEYLLLATNIRLSAVAGTGGIDTVNAWLAQYRDPSGQPLKGWMVWHAEHIERLLDLYPGIRAAYAPLVLIGDVIARLLAQLDDTTHRIEHAWLGHASRALLAATDLTLGESGDPLNASLSLAEVAVDLPAQIGRDYAGNVLANVVGRAEVVLKPSCRAKEAARVVILGGPGQGKSTISRLLCQIYRIALLDSTSSLLGDEVTHAAESISAAFDAGGLPAPTLPRIPIFVVLGEYADKISGGSDESLLRHIASLINHRASEKLGDSDVKKLLREWPSIVVLDGLDEVADSSIRGDVSVRITEFMNDMAMNDADVFLVCTTRPYGFADILPETIYDRLTLSSLKVEEALKYTDKLLAARYRNDQDKREIVLKRMADAAYAPATQTMLSSPLQVTIMTILLDSQSKAPTTRHELFSRYYATIYAREVNKPGWPGERLAHHRAHIDALHERAAVAIHRMSETAGDAGAVISESDLHTLATEILEAEGYRSESIPIADTLIQLARERLVLLVPRGGGFGFELRSLQEFMTARAIIDGSEEEVVQRLRVLAISAHWRNAWLLAVGRIFSITRSLRAEVVLLLQAVDNDSFATMYAKPGARLALEVLIEGIAADSPRFEVDLATTALGLLDGARSSDVARLGAYMSDRFHNQPHDVLREIVQIHLRARLDGSSSNPLPALDVLAALQRAPGPAAEWARLESNRAVPGLISRAPGSGSLFEEPVDEVERIINSYLPLNNSSRFWNELTAAVRGEGLTLDFKEVRATFGASIGASLGPSSSRTLEIQLVRDVGANLARDLPISRWTDATAASELLVNGIARDSVGVSAHPPLASPGSPPEWWSIASP